MTAPEHFDEARIAELCDMATVTDWLEQAWQDLANGKAATTLRVRASAEGIMGSAMAATWPRHRTAGGKLYLTHANGFSFLVALFSPEGGLLATFDGKGLTAIRTAAATALAIRYLAPTRSNVAAVLGTGTQSKPHLMALAQELDLHDLRIWGRNTSKASKVADWGKAQGLPARAVTDADDAGAGARVIATVTASYEPLFNGKHLEPGALVCAVGSTKAARRELDGITVQRAGFVVSDSAEGARTEAGDLIQAASEGIFDWDRLIDLTDVVSGKIQPPERDERIVLYESQGVALQDVVIATLAYLRAHPS